MAPRHATLVLAALLLALPGCQLKKRGGPTAEAPPAAPAPAQAAAPAAPAPAPAPAPAAEPAPAADQPLFSLAGPGPAAPVTPATAPGTGCRQADGGRMSFRIGSARLAIAKDTLRGVVADEGKTQIGPKALQQPIASIAGGAGCPESPMKAQLVVQQTDLGNALLSDTVAISEARPQLMQDYTRQITRLQKERPADGCRLASNDLLACYLVETQGERRTEVLFLITTDPNQKLGFGAPLSIRCTRTGEKIEACHMVDQLRSGVMVQVALNPGTYSTKVLRDAVDAANRHVTALTR